MVFALHSLSWPLKALWDEVIEMARIFGVDIKNEPYLVHVLKRALRHYGNCVKEKRKVKEPRTRARTRAKSKV